MERSITGSRSAKFAFVTSILPVLRSKVLAQNNRFSSKKRTKGTHQRTNCLLAEGRWEGTTVGELKQYPITLRSLSLVFFLYSLSSPLPSTEPAVRCFPACYFLIEMRRRQERRSIALWPRKEGAIFFPHNISVLIFFLSNYNTLRPVFCSLLCSNGLHYAEEEGQVSSPYLFITYCLICGGLVCTAGKKNFSIERRI